MEPQSSDTMKRDGNRRRRASLVLKSNLSYRACLILMSERKARRRKHRATGEHDKGMRLHVFLTVWPPLAMYFRPSSRAHRHCPAKWHKPGTLREVNLITTAMMTLSEFDPDLWSNGLVYPELGKCSGCEPHRCPTAPSRLHAGVI